ncbi:GlxA family transcriptional regulator [Rufibacter ruber]|uniref:GlxA family transcriptional regulator n=1 Tax=Rufibacter ruber TaxID=1783499 RepID=UPI00082DDD2E|nr:helix-turn-helix domain-containing protein [Rufibacter ruber]
MKHITLLVPEGAILGSVEGPRQVLTEANKLLLGMGKPALFKIQLVGLTREVKAAGGIYTVYTDATIHDVPHTDLVLIPALDGDLAKAVQANAEFMPWIVQQYQTGAEVASLCVGAFLLASTGLVNGRKCATHWMAANAFRKMFPEVELVEDSIITDEHRIYSSGGAFSYLNLVLYLLEKFAGREIAVVMSKAFQIDIDRRSQSPFVIFQGQKDHEDDLIKQAQEFIEANYQEKISVDDLASNFYLGRRNLERRFKKATCNTVLEYIQRVKMEAAKMRFESSQDNVNEVMFTVGYSDPKAFRATFKKITGLSPLEYRNKYNKVAGALQVN